MTQVLNKQKFNAINVFLLKEIICIFILISSIVFVISTTYNNFVAMNASEVPNISLNPVYIFLLFIILFTLLVRYYDFLGKINSNYLFFILLTIFILAGIYLVIFSDDYLRIADPGTTVDIARQFNKGDFSMLKAKSSYINEYPYQIYWISWLRVLLGINNSVRFLYWINLVLSTISLIFIFLISKNILNQKETNLAVVLSFLFMPQLFNVLFVYANVISLTLFLGSSFFFIYSLKKNHSGNWILLTDILLVMSYLLKNNYLIGIIAFFVTLLFVNLNIKKKILSILLILLMIFFANIFVGKYYSSQVTDSKFAFSSGVPKSAFIMMGLNEHGSKSGWFDNSTVELYKKHNFSSVETNKAANKKLENRISNFRQYPQNAVIFFGEKCITTWSDPTFQSLWNGPLPTWQGKLRTEIFKKIYSIDGNSKTSRLIRRISQFTIWTVLIGSLIMGYQVLVDKVKDNTAKTYIIFVCLFFIGGFLFHTFWETKAQYVYQYIIMLIPSAAMGIDILSKKSKRNKENKV